MLLHIGLNRSIEGPGSEFWIFAGGGRERKRESQKLESGISVEFQTWRQIQSPPPIMARGLKKLPWVSQGRCYMYSVSNHITSPFKHQVSDSAYDWHYFLSFAIEWPPGNSMGTSCSHRKKRNRFTPASEVNDWPDLTLTRENFLWAVTIVFGYLWKKCALLPEVKYSGTGTILYLDGAMRCG